MKLQTVRRWWRPILAWAFVVGWSATLGTTLVLLVMEKATLNDASGLLIALVAGGATPATTYAYARTREKTSNIDDYGPPPDWMKDDFEPNP